MNNADSPLHVVLGQGQIGTRVRDLLLQGGQRVRVVRQGPIGLERPGLEQVRGDLSDLAFAEQATRGAAVVYDCMNPPYDKWSELLLPIGRGAVHGASKAGAKLVALDCLYMYGRPTGPIREDSPLNPCSKKGELRVQLGALRLDAHERGDLRVSIGRASDFFGPGLQYSGWSERFFKRIKAGKAGECTGDPNMPHAYSYADDVAKALVVLGARNEADGRVWHLPTLPAIATQALADHVGRALGVPAKVARVPRWLLRTVGVFSPMMRELAEMTYQWEVPFVLDDTRFRTTFGVDPTPLALQVQTTAAWARALG